MVWKDGEMGMTGQRKLKQAINGLEQFIADFKPFCGNKADWQRVYDALALLKEHEPKLPKHIHEEYSEHDWQRDGEGNIDMWGIEYGYHNGPTCTRCDYSFCIHCEPDGYNAEPCIVDEYRCPSCGVLIEKKQAFCVNCGQAVRWE